MSNVCAHDSQKAIEIANLSEPPSSCSIETDPTPLQRRHELNYARCNKQDAHTDADTETEGHRYLSQGTQAVCLRGASEAELDYSKRRALHEKNRKTDLSATRVI